MSTRTYILVIIGLVLTCLLDILIPDHHHTTYFWHRMPGFEAFYGFCGCVLIVFGSKAIGKHWLWRTATSVNLPESLELIKPWFLNGM